MACATASWIFLRSSGCTALKNNSFEGSTSPGIYPRRRNVSSDQCRGLLSMSLRLVRSSSQLPTWATCWARARCASLSPTGRRLPEESFRLLAIGNVRYGFYFACERQATALLGVHAPDGQREGGGICS